MSELAHYVFLFVIGILILALVVRYLYWEVDQDLKDLARLETDPEYRRQELARVDQRIADSPTDFSSRRRRADIRRHENDHPGVIEDLRVFLGHAPSDDTAWCELAESLLAVGAYAEALTAASQATLLDGNTAEYHALRNGAALLAGDLGAAHESLDNWQALESAAVETDARRPQPKMLAGRPVPRQERDLMIPLRRAALALAEGNDEQAMRLVREVGSADPCLPLADLQTDASLEELLQREEVRSLLADNT